MIDPEEFANSFMAWVRETVAVSAGQVIAMDGKVLRGSQDNADGKVAIHLMSAWAEANHLVLGQPKIDEKTVGLLARAGGVSASKRLLLAETHAEALPAFSLLPQ